MRIAALLALSVTFAPVTAGAQPGVSPDGMTPTQRLQSLKGAPAVERREPTSVAVGSDAAPADAARGAAIADVIRDYERRNGAERGTVAYFRGSNADYLALDFAKSRKAALGGGNKMFSAVGGHDGAGAGQGPPTTLMLANVEYKSEATRRGSEDLVAFTAGQGSAIAGRAAKTGDTPVSLNLDTAKLTAVQVPQGAAGLSMPVAVTVGGKTQTLQPGQTAAFGDLEVEVESSVNYSSLAPGQREGPAYGLSVRVRSFTGAAHQ